MGKTKTYQGLISMHSWGEADDILFLSGLSDPLAKELEWMHGETVTVRYWITDTQCTKDQAEDAFLRMVMGIADVELESRYSEISGYLWTDENLNVGGHNLLGELQESAGKWLILEVDVVPNSEIYRNSLNRIRQSRAELR